MALDVLGDRAPDPLLRLGIGHPVAAEEHPLIGQRQAGDLPADREPLEEQLAAPPPGVVHRRRAAPERLADLRDRARAQRLPQGEDVARGIGVVDRRRRRLPPPLAALGHSRRLTAGAGSAVWQDPPIIDQQSISPEDLPDLELRPLRQLDLESEPGEERAPHIASASGVVRRGVFAYVIGDDELDLAVFDLSGDRPGTLRRALEGELPSDADARAKEKPDLEALTTVPPFEGSPYGGILGLGSGSNERRDGGFFWALDADGSLRDDPRQLDLSPLYRVLREQLGEINVEGACVFGDRLWLFNRGNRGDSPNAVAELALPDLGESLRGDLEIDPEELSGLRAYELGDLDGVDLCFSDATPLSDRLVVFTASAEEDNPDGPDGGIRGSVVGTIDDEGVVHRLRTIDRKWKVEGVDAKIDTGVVDLVFVCDQDEPGTPSPLLTATMPLDAKFEQDAGSSAQD